MSDRDEKVEVSKDLLEIKEQVRNPVKKRLHQNQMQQITSQLKDLSEKVGEIQENLSQGKSSQKKLKRKKEIIYLLKQKGKISTTQLSKEVDLSRTRCSEYLNEMRKEGILTSEKDGKTKKYMLDL